MTLNILMWVWKYYRLARNYHKTNTNI